MENSIMGRYDEENLRNLKQQFDIAPDDDFQPVLDRIAMEMAQSLTDLEGVKVTSELCDYNRSVGIAISLTLNGREYAHAIRMRPGIDYSPVFRGWYSEITEKLEKLDNHSAA